MRTHWPERTRAGIPPGSGDPLKVPFAPQIVLPYAAGAAALLVGAFRYWLPLLRARMQEAPALLGPILLASGMAVFGADHLTQARAISGVVPAWMPWRLFWAVIVGVALVAAACGLATGIRAKLAAFLLGVMICLFALLIFLPWWLGAPHSRVRATLLLRDLTLGCSCIAFAARGRPRVAGTVRIIVAAAMGFYGIVQLLHPESAPGIPQDGPAPIAMPPWIPAHALWTYVSGVVFVIASAGLLLPQRARAAASGLGAFTGVLALCVYVPLALWKPADVDNGLNYLAIHLALAGALLALAAALPSPPDPED